MKPVVYIVGADKGGVGKTTITRALIDYLDLHGVGNRAFDTQTNIAGGTLKRFYPERAELADLLDSDDQMRVFDTLNAQIATVIDIRADLLTPALQLLGDIGFLDPARLDVRVLHVLGNNQTSVDEVAPVAAKLAGMRHIPVGNRINATKFAFPADALDIPMLPPAVAEAVDMSSLPFSVFIKSSSSVVQRGLVNTWLDRVFAQFARVRLP
jgi:hypothetical protein